MPRDIGDAPSFVDSCDKSSPHVCVFLYPGLLADGQVDSGVV